MDAEEDEDEDESLIAASRKHFINFNEKNEQRF